MSKDKKYSIYPVIQTATIVIATSTTISPEVDLSNYHLVGITAPSTMEGTDITFSGATASGGTFMSVAASNAASTAYKIVTAASTYTPVDPTIFRGLRYIKLITATVQTTTDTIFSLHLIPKSFI